MSTSSTNTQNRKWTFMVYLAGDNDLENFGTKDLAEMKMVGSSEEAAIVAQFDRMSDQVTRRYYIAADQSIEADQVDELSEVNTGDPQTLLNFVRWACEAYPAEHYALVLWNHGSGWKDDDIYRMAKQKGVQDQIHRGQVRRISGGKSGRVLFQSTIERLIDESIESERAIAFDDSSADFLDNIELKNVLEKIVQQIGRPLDLLGFDACLMNMLEVHYQLRGLCKVIVGSQEIEPGDGWPYQTALAPLLENPTISPEELGKNIVNRYVEFYRAKTSGPSITQSAVSLVHIEQMAKAVDTLARALTEAPEQQMVGKVFAALRSTQTFTDRDYVDLIDFCQNLSYVTEPSDAAIRQALEEVFATISPIIATEHYGPAIKNANGLSVYLPTRYLSPLYDRLDFAARYQWDNFLRAFTGLE